MPNLNSPSFLLASSLQAAHCEFKSWRKVARKFYQGKVHFATLCRIAKSNGRWLPKDKEVLALLGMLKIRPKADEHTKRVRRKINHMARETKEALNL